MREIRVQRTPSISLTVTETGTGPLVLLVHGFPESWYSWRHQMGPLAAAGYRAAALHVRGYGASSKPDEIESYTLTELAGDIAAVIRALEPRGAFLIGHDWGAMQVQTAALLYPELVRGIATLSVPAVDHPADKPSSIWPERYRGRLFYQAYFQQPGIAEAEFEPDLDAFIRIFFHGLSGEGDPFDSPLIRPGTVRRLHEGLEPPAALPDWLEQQDVDHYVAAFASGGLTGPLNRYRCADLDWAQLAPFAERRITAPALFLGGSRDPSRYMIPGYDRYADAIPRMTDPRGQIIVDDVGHWIQQEAASVTTAHILRFLGSIT